MNDQSLLSSLPPSSPTASLPISSHPQVRLVVALCSLEYTALCPAQHGTDTVELTAIGKTKEDKEVSLRCVVQDRDVHDRGL